MIIEQITFRTAERADGTTYEVVRLWIAGIPFSADLMPQVERTARRISKVLRLPIIDVRRKETDHAHG